MYYFLQKFHSGWAYLALVLLVFAVINSVMGFTSGKAFTDKDRKISLFALIGTHVQLLVGLFLYFVSPLGHDGLGQMSDALVRKSSLEHPLTVLIAIILITIGWSKHKKTDDSTTKFKTIMWGYTIGLVLILSRLPWHLWF